MTPHVAIIVLNWNGLADTLACLASLAELDYPTYDVVVVDNGSTDGSPTVIREQFPDVRVIETGENLGYAGGNNVGAEYALESGADYLFILNNDTVLNRDILSRLVRAAEADARVGAVGPKIYYYARPQRIWFAGGMIDWKQGVSVNLGAGEEDVGQFGTVRSVDFLAGCALLIKAKVWKKVGSFDTRFFMYWEETDWCVRARRAGYSLLFVPQAVMWHKVSVLDQSHSPHILYYMTRNRLLFLRKNLAPSQRWGLVLRCGWGLFRNVLNFLRHGEHDQAKAVARGGRDFLWRRFGPASVISHRGTAHD